MNPYILTELVCIGQRIKLVKQQSLVTAQPDYRRTLPQDTFG